MHSFSWWQRLNPTTSFKNNKRWTHIVQKEKRKKKCSATSKIIIIVLTINLAMVRIFKSGINVSTIVSITSFMSGDRFAFFSLNVDYTRELRCWILCVCEYDADNVGDAENEWNSVFSYNCNHRFRNSQFTLLFSKIVKFISAGARKHPPGILL